MSGCKEEEYDKIIAILLTFCNVILIIYSIKYGWNKWIILCLVVLILSNITCWVMTVARFDLENNNDENTPIHNLIKSYANFPKSTRKVNNIEKKITELKLIAKNLSEYVPYYESFLGNINSNDERHHELTRKIWEDYNEYIKCSSEVDNLIYRQFIVIFEIESMVKFQHLKLLQPIQSFIQSDSTKLKLLERMWDIELESPTRVNAHYNKMKKSFIDISFNVIQMIDKNCQFKMLIEYFTNHQVSTVVPPPAYTDVFPQ